MDKILHTLMYRVYPLVCHEQHQHNGTLINACFSQNPNYKDITVSEHKRVPGNLQSQGIKKHSESECKSIWFLKAPIVSTMQHSVFTACAYEPRSSCTGNQNMTPCQRVLGAFALCCAQQHHNCSTAVGFSQANSVGSLP